jgi:hypothetical protein
MLLTHCPFIVRLQVSTITAAAYASSLAAARAGTHTTGQLGTRRLQSAAEDAAAPTAKPRKILQRSLLGSKPQQQQQQQQHAKGHHQATALNSYLGSMYLAPLPAVVEEVQVELESREAANVTVLVDEMPGIPRYMEGPHQHQHGNKHPQAAAPALITILIGNVISDAPE